MTGPTYGFIYVVCRLTYIRIVWFVQGVETSRMGCPGSRYINLYMSGRLLAMAAFVVARKCPPFIKGSCYMLYLHKVSLCIIDISFF